MIISRTNASKRTRTPRRLLAGVAALIAAVAVACGSPDGDEEPTATLPPNFTPIPSALLTPGPPPEVSADTQLVSFTGDKLPYDMEYPEGWIADTSGASLDRFTLRTPDRGDLGLIQVTCATSLEGQSSPHALKAEDLRLIRASQTPINDLGTQEITIDGKQALRWQYEINLGAVRAYQWVYYIQDVSCVWRVRMVVYGTEPGNYGDLFDRVAETFDSRLEG